MKDVDRFKLYFGPYKTPRFKYGKKVWCEYRGWMKIVGLSDGKIQWPIGRPITAPTGRDSLIIYGDLKRAIEQERKGRLLVGCRPLGIARFVIYFTSRYC